MHLRPVPVLAFAVALLSASFPFAADKPAPAPAKPAEDYPLTTCVVSNDPLPADAVTYTHREPGKPDRILRFCCEGCIEDFKGDPAKFLKKLDAAAREQAKKK